MNCQGRAASLSDLEFKPEINDAFELGAKYNGPGIDVNVAVFRQLFRNFQLNTFNGLNFVVENINSCKDDLLAPIRIIIRSPAHARANTQAGVKSRGIEIEAFTRPFPNFSLNAGLVYATRAIAKSGWRRR